MNELFAKVADRFLNHRDQEFRLSYVFGSWRNANDQKKTDEEHEVVNNGLDNDGQTDFERAKNREVLEVIMDWVNTRALAPEILERLSNDLDIEPREPMSANRKALEQLFEENYEKCLTKDESFHDLVQDILNRILECFDLIRWFSPATTGLNFAGSSRR